MTQNEQHHREAHGSGRNLEEAFFARQDAELTEKIRIKNLESESKEQLAQATGIQDERVLDELFQFGMNTQTIAALCLVPLIEVAWADGTLDDRERAAVLKAVEEEGIKPGSSAYQLLMEWMNHPEPELGHVWSDYVTALCRIIPADVANLVREEVMGRAYAVAKASGGFLGFGHKVGKAEKKVLEKLEAVFAKLGPSS